MQRVRYGIISSVLAAMLVLGIHGTAEAQAGLSVPIRVIHGRSGQVVALAQVALSGRAYYFIIDTGASVSLIDRRVARRLKLARAGRPRRAAGVFGGGFVQPVRISKWSLGHYLPLPSGTIDEAAVASGPVVGLLGSDVLSRFGRVTIDFQHGVLTLG